MANDRGNRKQDPAGGASRPEEADAIGRNEGSGRLAPLPELMRRALSLGLSGFFLTEEAIRKALGDTLPKDWIDFAVDQSERTRKEFLERLTFEMGRSLENVDVATALRDLLEGRTLEIRAEVRLRDREDDTGPRDPGAASRRR